MGYKILGFTVWHGGRWYLRRRYGHLIPSRRVVAAVVVGAVGAVAAWRVPSRPADPGGRDG